MSESSLCTTVVALPIQFSQEGQRILDGQSKICNWLSNHLLEKANQLKEEYKESQDEHISLQLYSKRGLRNLLPKIKEEHLFLKSVHSSPLKNVALRLSSSIQDYQKSRKGLRKGKNVGWPKFRSWKEKWFSLLYDEPNKGFKVGGNSLILSLGVDDKNKRLKLEGKLLGAKALKGKEIRNLRVTRNFGKYQAIFTVKCPVPDEKKIHSFVSLDPNHKNLVYGVDNRGVAFEVQSPKWLKRLEKRLDELKSKRDSCKRKSYLKEVVISGKIKKIWEPSRAWKKYHKVLHKMLQKRREQTKTFMYTLANALCKKYDCVGIGDYTPGTVQKYKSMNRSMNNQSLIGRFKDCLSWVCLKSGKFFIEYDEKNTTRQCHNCKDILDKGLEPEIRSWNCETCQTHHLRDENAAINGLRRVKEALLKKKNLVPGSGLAPVVERWAWKVLPRGLEMDFGGRAAN